MQVFSRLGSTVYTILKTKVKKAMASNFPNISFSDEPTNQDPVFPNVFFQQLQPVEQGQTLDGNNINAMLDTVQITVTTNTSKSDANKVAWACVDALKSIRYDMVMLPIYSIQTKESTRIHTFTFRARRIVGDGDVL